jgi:2-dehydropantoate 2-reductase
MAQHSPRIGMIGSGAIGGYFGYHLARAGFDVHFLLRSEYDAIARHGLTVIGKQFADAKPIKVNAYRSVDEMPKCDWLLLGAKATSNAALAPLLARVAAPGAKVICLQNGLGVEDTLRSMLPASLHLLGGLCWLGVHREAPGVVRHVALNGIHIGYHSGPTDERVPPQSIVEEAVAMFAAAGQEAKAIADLTEERWRKLVWNMPYNGACALLKVGTHLLSRHPDGRPLLLELMEEVLQGAAACGYPLPEGLPKQMIELTESFDDYLPSMYFDAVLQRPMELDAMYAQPLASASEAGCSLPRMEALHRTLSVLDTLRNVAPAQAGLQ